MVELDQFKYTLSTYEKPIAEVRVALNLDAKMKKIDELDRTMEEPSFWEDADRAAKLVKEAKVLKDTVEGFNKLQNSNNKIVIKNKENIKVSKKEYITPETIIIAESNSSQ